MKSALKVGILRTPNPLLKSNQIARVSLVRFSEQPCSVYTSRLFPKTGMIKSWNTYPLNQLKPLPRTVAEYTFPAVGTQMTAKHTVWHTRAHPSQFIAKH